MTKQETPRKLREDLSPQEREQAERIGSLSFKSPRDANRKLIRVKYSGIGPKGRAA